MQIFPDNNFDGLSGLGETYTPPLPVARHS